MQFRIRKLIEDEETPHVEIFVSGNNFAAHQDSWINDNEWLEFGLALRTFPRNIKHEVVLEDGTPEADYYTLLRALVYDGVGHCALEVRIRKQSDPPYSASAHFFILSEAVTLNLLGKELESWAKSKQGEFVFTTDAE